MEKKTIFKKGFITKIEKHYAWRFKFYKNVNIKKNQEIKKIKLNKHFTPLI